MSEYELMLIDSSSRASLDSFSISSIILLLTLNQYVNSAVSTVATINNPALFIFALLAAYLTADLHSSVPSKTAKKFSFKITSLILIT